MNSTVTKKLVEQAAKGCRKSFDQLTVLCLPRLESLIRLRMGSSLRSQLEVDDVVQETCLQAFRSVHTFQWTGGGSFHKWLGGIAEHVILDQVRKLRTRKRGFEQAAANGHTHPVSEREPVFVSNRAQETTSPLKALLREERFVRLEKALASLSNSHREVILLARVRGLSLQEIGMVLNCTPKAASMLLVRAIRKLRVAFGRTESFKLPPWTLDPNPGGATNGSSETGRGTES